MRRILWIAPGTEKDWKDALEDIKNAVNSLKFPDTKIDVAALESAPETMEYLFFEHLAADGILRKVKEAETSGYDAVIIGCAADPSLREAREIVNIPVVGAGEAAMHLAAMLGHKFSIIIGGRKHIPKMSDNAKIYGFDLSKIVWGMIGEVWRDVSGPAGKSRNIEKLKQAILDESRRVVEEEGAEVVILGCAGMIGLAEQIQCQLGVPVIEPLVAALKTAEILADLKIKLGISHSKKYSYEFDLTKHGYDPEKYIKTIMEKKKF